MKIPDLTQLNKKTIIIVAAVSVLIAGLDYAFIVSAQLKAIRTKAKIQVKLKDELSQLKKKLSGLIDVRALVKGKDGLRSRIKRMVSESETALLLQDISDLASANGVKITQIRPVKEVKEAAKGRKSKKDTAKTSAADKKSVPSPGMFVAIDAICNYTALTDFFYGIDENPVFLAVDELRISANPNNYSQHNVALRLKAYIRK